MKRILLIFALAPSLVLAAGWGLTRSYGSFPTEAGCRAAAASQPAGTYLCSNVLQSSVTVGTTPPPPVNPFPNGETRTVQCVAPTVGNWTQTRTYTLTGTTWIAGAWSPATAPAGACTTPSTGGPLKASLTASRVTGTAPLAVLFDAAGTTGAAGIDTFRQVTYSFDFGDDRALTWAVSGKPKNSETGGPLAAHVFDLPGTYTVRLSATDGAGNASTSTVTITVNDPAAVFAGTKTLCVGKDFAGCPAGAAQQGAMPASPVIGKRILLQRGQSFGAVDLQSDSANVQVGAYGTGAAPIVASVGVGSWRPTTVNFPVDVVVADLSVSGGIGMSMGSRALFLRNAIGPVQIQVALGNSGYWTGEQYRLIPADAFRNIAEVFVVENTGLGSNTANTEYGLYGELIDGAMLGNRFGVQKYHSTRITAAHRVVIAHNEIQGISSSGGYHALKLHSNGLKPFSPTLINPSDGVSGWASDQIVLANNTIGNAKGNDAWTSAISSQNDQYAEGIEKVIVESNTFVRGPGTQTDYVMGGRNFTQRGNKTGTGGAISTGIGHTGALPAAWNGPYYAQ